MTNLEHTSERCISIINSGYGGGRVLNYDKMTSPLDALVIYYLLNGVRNVTAHIQHWSGRVEVDTLMTWSNNLVVWCKPNTKMSTLFDLTKKVLKECNCGWIAGDKFGCGVVANNPSAEQIKELIVRFHSVKSEFSEAYEKLKREN